MRRSSITPAFVDIIPDRLEEGTLYVCERYKTVAHKCCCGCGEEVITPLSPADWSLRKAGNTVSLTPSIGNWSFACKSHYWISRNRVVWAGSMSQRQIEQVRSRDKADKNSYIAAINRQKEQQARPASLFPRIWQALVDWWKS
jgi:hypothetical protein